MLIRGVENVIWYLRDKILKAAISKAEVAEAPRLQIKLGGAGDRPLGSRRVTFYSTSIEG